MEKEIKKLKEFQRWFDRFIKKGYGKKCSGFAWGCSACHAHFVKEIFDDFVEDLVGTEKWFEKQKKKTKIRRKKK